MANLRWLMCVVLLAAAALGGCAAESSSSKGGGVSGPSTSVAPPASGARSASADSGSSSTGTGTSASPAFGNSSALTPTAPSSGAGAGTGGTSGSSTSTMGGTSASTSSGGGNGSVAAGTLTAGAWDDNRNFDRFTKYRSDLLQQNLAGVIPTTDAEHKAAFDLASKTRGARQTLDVALVIDTTGSMGDEMA